MTDAAAAHATPSPRRPGEVASSGLRSWEIHAVRGLFIALIVVGHNTALQRVLPSVSTVLYNFHIFAFFLLPFLMPSRPLSVGFLRDRAVRYGVPHLVFFGLACVLYTLFVRSGPVESWLADLARALVLQSPGAIGAASGLRVYWFLPALFSLALLRGLGARLGPGGRAGLLCAGVMFHLFAGWLPREVGDSLFYGVGVALFVLPLGVLGQAVWRGRDRIGRIAFTIASGGLAVGLGSLAWSTGHAVRLASLRVYAPDEPLWILVHAVLPVAAFAAACGASPLLARIPGVVLLGRHSLVVFLVHQLVYQALLRIPSAAGFEPPLKTAPGSFAVASILLTLALSVGVGLGIARSRTLSAWILPRNAAEWPPLARRGL